MDNSGIVAIIQNIQNQIWEAEYFISLGVNVEYWQGRVDSYKFTLDNFRSVGISVSEVTNGMSKPIYK